MKKILWDRLPPQLKISQVLELGLFDCGATWLSILCKKGLVPAFKRGNLWIFNTSELKKYFGIE